MTAKKRDYPTPYVTATNSRKPGKAGGIIAGMPVAHERPLAFLGGLSATRFMREYWQKKPLLVRAAYPPDWITPLEVREMAAGNDIEARLVSRQRGRWKVSFGPQQCLPRQRRDWTLLVQGVNLYHAAAAQLLQSIDFLPAWRLDDVMLSYAVPGGGVGPHIDSYDVFLLQVTGRRIWRISRSTDQSMVPNLPLKILANFEPEDEWLLEPGDMLYLPPHVAHDGIADSECLTASVGFRAPSYEELTREFLHYVADHTASQGIYGDRGRKPTQAPGELDDDLIEKVSERLLALQFAKTQVIEFLGSHLSEPKATVFFDQHTKKPQRLRSSSSLVLDPRSIMLYRGGRFFLNGESIGATALERRLLQRLANQRRLDATELKASTAALNRQLEEWLDAGWLHVEPRHLKST